MAIKCKLSLFGFTCLLFLALGCAEIKEFYHGNTVSSVPVIVLQEGTPNAGRWETFDLIIDYEYILLFRGRPPSLSIIKCCIQAFLEWSHISSSLTKIHES
jgi:hypothetical protein